MQTALAALQFAIAWVVATCLSRSQTIIAMDDLIAEATNLPVNLRQPTTTRVLPLSQKADTGSKPP